MSRTSLHTTFQAKSPRRTWANSCSNTMSIIPGVAVCGIVAGKIIAGLSQPTVRGTETRCDSSSTTNRRNAQPPSCVCK